MTTATATTSSSQILRHTTAFISGVISQPELRRHLIATLLREAPISDQATLKHLNLAAETVESAITFSSAAIRASSLSLAEKLLLPLPALPLSSFLLSLVFALSNRTVDSAISLLRIFHSTPSLSRSEIAPVLYDHLFSLHLLPVFRWFDEQRTRVLSNSSSDAGDYEYSITEESVMLPCAKLLSRMSGDQASKLRELEREYEEALDENCRVVAAYFEEVLLSESGEASINPPLLTLKSAEEGDGRKKKEEIEETEMPVLENGRYNVMLYLRIQNPHALVFAFLS